MGVVTLTMHISLLVVFNEGITTWLLTLVTHYHIDLCGGVIIIVCVWGYIVTCVWGLYSVCVCVCVCVG